MIRKITALAMVVAFATLSADPVGAAKPKKTKPVTITYYMNWVGNCAGNGYLARTFTPPDPWPGCAIWSPTPGTYQVSKPFPGSDGLPFALDATKTITVDFDLVNNISVAADFEVVFTGTVNGKEQVIASGVQTILAGGGQNQNVPESGTTPFHYDLEPDHALHNATLESLTLTVSLTNGQCFCKIDLNNGTASMVIHGRK